MAGQPFCEPCSAFQLGRESHAGATTCDFCGENLYLGDDQDAVDGRNCFECPAHATCAAGTTLQTLHVHPGYWRTEATSPKLKACFLKSACVGGNSSVMCAEGYHRTLCASCEPNFYREVSTGECRECDAAASRRTRDFFGLHLFLLFLFCASPLFLARAVRNRAHALARRRFKPRRVVPDNLFVEAPAPAKHKAVVPDGLLAEAPAPAKHKVPTHTGRIQGAEAVADAEIFEALTTVGAIVEVCRQDSSLDALVTLEAKASANLSSQLQIGAATYTVTWSPVSIDEDPPMEADKNAMAMIPEEKQTDDVTRVLRLIEEAIVVKAKIVITFLQSMCYLPKVYYGVRWPAQLTEVLELFNPLNLDFLSLVQLECAVSTGLNFYHRLLVVTLGPISVALALCAAALVARRRGRHAGAAAFIDLVLKLCFFVFSSTSTSIFQAFACDDSFDDGRAVLAADYSISCKTDRWRAFAAYAGVMVAVYPVGIVCLFTALLCRHRDAIDPPLGAHGKRPHSLAEALTVDRSERCSLAERCKHASRHENEKLKSIRFLFVHYLPKYWYFEPIESVRRLLVTAIAVTVQPGSSTQLAFGLLTSILSLLLYAALQPFIHHADNNLAILAATILTLTTFSGLLLSSDVVEDDGWSLLGMGTFLAICTALVVILGLGLAVLEARRLLSELAAATRRSAETPS